MSALSIIPQAILLPLLPSSIFRPSSSLFPAGLLFIASILTLANLSDIGSIVGILGWAALKLQSIWIVYHILSRQLANSFVTPTLVTLTIASTGLRVVNLWADDHQIWTLAAAVTGMIQESGVFAVTVIQKDRWRKEKLVLLSQILAFLFELFSLVLRPPNPPSPFAFFGIQLGWHASAIILSSLLVLRYFSLEQSEIIRSQSRSLCLPLFKDRPSPLPGLPTRSTQTEKCEEIHIRISAPDDNDPAQRGLKAVSPAEYIERRRLQTERRLVGMQGSMGKEPRDSPSHHGPQFLSHRITGSSFYSDEDDYDNGEICTRNETHDQTHSWGNLGNIEEMTEDVHSNVQHTGLGIIFRGDNVSTESEEASSNFQHYSQSRVLPAQPFHRYSELLLPQSPNLKNLHPVAPMKKPDPFNPPPTSGYEMEEMPSLSSVEAWQAIAKNYEENSADSSTSSAARHLFAFGTSPTVVAGSSRQTTPGMKTSTPETLVAVKSSRLSKSWSCRESASDSDPLEVQHLRRWSDVPLLSRDKIEEEKYNEIDTKDKTELSDPLDHFPPIAHSTPPRKEREKSSDHQDIINGEEWNLPSFSTHSLSEADSSFQSPVKPPVDPLNIQIPPRARAKTIIYAPPSPPHSIFANLSPTISTSSPTSPATASFQQALRKSRSHSLLTKDKKWQWWKTGTVTAVTPPQTYRDELSLPTLQQGQGRIPLPYTASKFLQCRIRSCTFGTQEMVPMSMSSKQSSHSHEEVRTDGATSPDDALLSAPVTPVTELGFEESDDLRLKSWWSADSSSEVINTDAINTSVGSGGGWSGKLSHFPSLSDLKSSTSRSISSRKPRSSVGHSPS